MNTLTFTTPPFGLAPATEFTVQALPGARGFYALRSNGVRLFVVDTAEHLPTYQPKIDQSRLNELGISEDMEPSVFVILTPREDGTTANLAAPIVINPETGQSAQIILEGQDMPLRWLL